MKAITLRRPVTLRASLIAASTAFVPVGPVIITLCSMPRGFSTIRSNASRNSALAPVYMSSAWAMPSPAMCSISAAFMSGSLCP